MKKMPQNSYSVMMVVLLLLLTSCGGKKQVIKTVPLREVTTSELEQVEIPADSTELRLLIDCLPNGTPQITQPQSATASRLQLLWWLNGSELRLKAINPPTRVQYLTRTVTKEVPVEVIKEVETNKFTWWQRMLMWVGIATLIYWMIRIGITIKR
jgi:hypothetical protein